MIPQSFVEQWRSNAPWQTLAMIEQDLVISRALVDLYNQSKIKTSLAFRGGTALNKLYIQPPARYSEDIDLVQIKPEPIGSILNAVRVALDGWLGEPQRKLTERSVKLVYRYVALDNTPAKLKIEINTTEHFHVQPLKMVDYSINSEWFQGKTKILTYQLNELMGTKLRALYERRKGRDLFDLWLVLSQQIIDVKEVITIFNHHCQRNRQPITRTMFEQNLLFKQQHRDFLSDILILLNTEAKWQFEEAVNLVQQKIISQLDHLRDFCVSEL
jgi:predicted nucleotidyltransferase component of viral defense system